VLIYASFLSFFFSFLKAGFLKKPFFTQIYSPNVKLTSVQRETTQFNNNNNKKKLNRPTKACADQIFARKCSFKFFYFIFYFIIIYLGIPEWSDDIHEHFFFFRQTFLLPQAPWMVQWFFVGSSGSVFQCPSWLDSFFLFNLLLYYIFISLLFFWHVFTALHHVWNWWNG
jgi:hypothetical protein